MTTTSTILGPRRVGVTGTVDDSKIAGSFCTALGRFLIARNAAVVTRGGRVDGSRAQGTLRPVDELAVGGACAALEERDLEPADWVETVLSPASEAGQRQPLRVGTLTVVGGQTYEAERFAFVNRLDGLIGIGGGRGTAQAILLALATERTVLPIPTFGGAAADAWGLHASELTRRFGLTTAAVDHWTAVPTNVAAAEELADEMVSAVLASMERRCFVAMPFDGRHNALYDFVIEPTIRRMGDQPFRTDRALLSGNVGDQIDRGIARADYLIVVLDDLRPNVLYELGMAHGRRKPTILLNRRDRLDDDSVPFDLTLHQRLVYDDIDAALPEKLERAIRALDDRRSRNEP